MLQTERDIQRKLRTLRHAEQIGDVTKTCRYFGIGRASFYRWLTAFQRQGESGLANRKTIPKNPANRTAPEIVAKVLHLRQTYHLGPIRIAGISLAITASKSLVRGSIGFSSGMG